MHYHTIITSGTFDMFHVGHLNLLKRLKNRADKLIVGVSTDEFNVQKGKRTLIPFQQRLEIVQAIQYVDIAIAETAWEQKEKDILHYNVDEFAIGDDWKGKFDHLNKHCQVNYLSRTEGISTTQLKNTLNSFSISKDEIIKALDILELLKEDLK